MRSLLAIAKGAAQLAPTAMETAADDWAPILLYEDRDAMVHTALLSTGILSGPNAAAALTTLRTILATAGAVQSAIITPCWTAPFDEYQTHVRPRDRADRQERVMVIHVDKDATRVEVAKVTRHETGVPALGAWDIAADGLAANGALIDTLRMAIG